MQEKCTLDIDDAEVYLIPQKEAGIGANLGTSHRLGTNFQPNMETFREENCNDGDLTNKHWDTDQYHPTSMGFADIAKMNLW